MYRISKIKVNNNNTCALAVGLWESVTDTLPTTSPSDMADRSDPRSLCSG